ncbi:MAG: SCP2 sterol-binding domain-containing protein [Promethearchaeota archaeon]|nr:MAG: SCP2 sterol-binding domain-containing protein [Candidatus Lokiarchaeota archaeon]
MGTKEQVISALQKWAKKIEDPEVSDRFEDWSKTVQFTMKDLTAHFKFIIENQKARIEEGLDEAPSMSVITTSDIIIGITEGAIDPMEAFMNGDLEAKGNLPDLTKLEVLMDVDDED